MRELVTSLVRTLRGLRRAPGFAALTIGTLALGVGADAAIFAVADAVLLHPLPAVRDVESLFAAVQPSVSLPALRDLQDAARAAAVADVTAGQMRPIVLAREGVSERVESGVVDGDFFRVLGVGAARGRLLAAGDDRPTSEPVAVLGDAYWRTAFGAAESAVGSDVAVNGLKMRIVGVLPADFRGVRVGHLPQVWIPVSAWSKAMPTSFARLGPKVRSWSWLTLAGRLRPGVSLAQAKAVLDAECARQEKAYPNQTRTGFSLQLAPAALAATGLRTRGEISRFVAVLSTVVALLLLLAAVSAAHLLLARGEARRQELAARLALGARPGRLLGEALLEPLVLALGGGAVGLGLARLLIGLGGRLVLPGGIPLAALGLHLDLRLAGFALLTALLTGGLAGLWPARRAARTSPIAALRGAEMRRGAGAGGALLVVQVALGVVLLVGTGLFLRALQAALSTDTGYRSEGVAFATVDLGLARYDAPRALAGLAAAERAVRALPGVVAAGWTSLPPLDADSDSESLRIPGYPAAPGEHPEVEVMAVSPGAIDALGIAVVRGRQLEDTAGERGLLVSEALARRYLDGEPLGRELRFDAAGPGLVVGVVRDVRAHSLLAAQPPVAYRTLATSDSRVLEPMTLTVRALDDPARAMARAVEVLRRELPGAPVFAVGTFDDLYAEALMPQRIGAALLGVFSLLGLLLAAVGTYGVVAYAVARRTREIGVRIALGARRRQIVDLFVVHGLRAAALGVGIGAALAAGLARGLASLLYGVSPQDGWTYAGAAAVLVVVAAAAAYFPARRAARLEPSVALRQE